VAEAAAGGAANAHAGDAAARARLPAYVVRTPGGAYHSLNPATKLVAALGEAVLAFVVGGWAGPAAVLAVVVACATVSRTLRSLGVVAAVTLPVVGSILLINTFLLPGATDAIVRVGPFAPTWSGLAFGIEVTLRLLAVSLALALAYLTPAVDDMLAELEGRGLGRRGVFVIGAAIQTVPRTVARAAEIVDAQRARGLDTEGRFWRRARGVVPLAAPVIFGALTDVEERTMALEARAFSAPGRRTTIRVPVDRAIERLFRWALVLAVLGAVALRLTGRLG
jgi:energy-coupling factor transport system permease protein